MSEIEGLKRVYGIDLGTTYSAIAYVDEHGKPVIVPNQESERITPSVVLFDGDNIIVGNTAKESAKVEPHRVVSRIKQHMGDPNFVFQYEGQSYSPEDISSFILRKVVGDAEIALGGEKITDVVITCPAYFGTPEREATANAGRLAGLNVRAILNEPTAAAIAYGLEQGEDQTVLVYDLGGGTFDITMIEIKDRLIRVICTGGDHHLGGVLWDEAIVMYLAEQFRLQTGEESDPLDDPEVLNDLFLQAERGKKTLTQREKAPFRVTHAGKQARVELDRAKFEEITKHLLDRTDRADPRDAGRRPGQGAHHVRQDHPGRRRDADAPGPQPARRRVQHGARELRPRRGRGQGRRALRPEGVAPRGGPGDPGQPRRRPRRRADGPIDLSEVPEAQVAQALDHLEKQLGFTLTGPVRELVNTRIVNVLSKSLGVIARDEQSKDVVVYLLPRNTEVPMERITDFGTDADNQAAVDIRVMSGERDSPEPLDCQEVGLATLNLPEKLPARSPIRVKFAINQDGRLNVTATRPDRRRLDRRRVPDRGRDERRARSRSDRRRCGCLTVS